MIHLLLSISLFLSPNDPRLNEESAQVCPCDIPSSEIQAIIDTMIQVAYRKTIDKTKSILVGLAAPQIGIQKRIILVDTAATGIFTRDIEPPPQIQEFINPEILWKSEEQTLWQEGCFSTSRICGIVPRSERVIIRAYDRDGNIATQEYDGYVAGIFQHEIDHLDGIRFPDRISDDNFLHWVEENEITEYRINWQNWTKKFARERWLEMKNLPKSY
jgi:peptide deformylase